ncbi:MAG: hypothetical protein GTO63_12745 [Anaerolineae bacterium]|nr:hypothetical protein [Anaerolineae bacterium]NIQ78684.1 hypothetical protein [Anaerolineae bacterium]
MVYSVAVCFEFVVIERFGRLMLEFPVPNELLTSKAALDPELAVNSAFPWVGWRRQALGSCGASFAGFRTLAFHDQIRTEFRPVLDLDDMHLYYGDCDELLQAILGCRGRQVVRRREWLGYLW